MRTTRKSAQGRLLGALTMALVLALLAALLLAGTALAAATPGKPTAKAPKGTITTTKPTFKWSKAPRAAKYELRVYKGTKLQVRKTGITKLSWKSSRALRKNVSLTWKVRARNARGNGAWSRSLKFKIVTASPATKYLLTSSGSSPVAGTSVTISAQLADASGNPVATAGKLVTWTKSGAGGPFAAASSTTNASGLATVAFTTHTLAGTATTVTGTSPGPLTGTSPSITTIAGAASKIVVNAGNAQTAVAGTALATAPSVIVKDVNDNVVAGVGVTFAVATGGGSAAGLAATTNASGTATVGSWTLGTTAGSNTLTATSGSLSGSPLTFSASGAAGAASKIAVNAGNAQSAVAGTALTTPPSVIVKDVNDNVVAGVSVTFAVATGGGSGTGLTATTNPSGIATVGSWTLGTSAGSNTLTATSAGLSGSPLTFTASGTAGAASKIAVNAGNAQTAVAGTALTTPPSVIVKDVNNNVVAGVSVTFAVATGGGSGTGLTATTNPSGIATVGSWTLGTSAGANTLTATSGSLSGSPLTFSASGTAGAASKLTITTQPVGAASGAPLGTQPIVRIEDSAGNLVSSSASITVTSSTGSTIGGGEAAGGRAAVAGVATFTNLTLAGTISTPYTLTFASSGLTSATSSSTTVTTGAATKLRITTQPLGAASGALLGTQPIVRIEDSAGNLVSSSASITVTSTGTIGGSQAAGLVAGAGVATFTNLTLAGTAGTPYTLTFASSGLTSATSSSTTVTTGAASKYLVTSSSYNPGAGTDVTISAQLADASGNPVSTSGKVVTWTKSYIGGSFATATSNTNASGLATVVFTTHTVAYTATTVTGTSPGPLTGDSPVITTRPLAIGDSYQGGIVAYILQPTDPGYASGTRGLIAAPDNQSLGIRWFNGSLITTGATGTELGTGSANTTRIITSQGAVAASYAAGLARAYTGGGYTDWYLPSKDELNKLDVNQASIGGFDLGPGGTSGWGSGPYWSSSEVGANYAWAQYFSTDVQHIDWKFGADYRVRAVRAFPANPAKAITAFSFQGLSPAVTGSINELAHTIGLTVPFGTDRNGLVATFTTTGAVVTVGSTTQVSGATPNNYASPVTYTVTAADASTQTYVVTVTVAAAVIGQSYGGGVIAYVFAPGDTGYVPGYPHGLIAAAADLVPLGQLWSNITDTAVGAFAQGTAIGTGKANTWSIANQSVGGVWCESGAAFLCDNLTLNTYSDWYLPSKDELNQLYLNRGLIGGFSSNYYYSSSEWSALLAWAQNFTDGVGTQSTIWKDTMHPVRAVRSF